MQIRSFEPQDQEQVIELWGQCNLLRPWNDPRKDIERKLKERPELFLVGVLGGRIIASVMAGYDGHRGWLNYVGVDPDHRHQDFGRAIMAEAERRLRELGCPKINLQVRSANRDAIDFYSKVGFALDDVVSMGKRLEHDDRE
jgi:ribosomal protein S18 acetylase RimI-like enzyme